MARGANASATLFNHYKNPNTKREEWRPVYLESVHWESRKGANIMTSGLEDADGLMVMIWFDVKAEGRRYVPPKVYSRLSPADVGNHWTLTEGKDRIIKGNVEDAVISERITEIVNAHDDCYTVTHVDAMDFGPVPARHWEVSGK